MSASSVSFLEKQCYSLSLTLSSLRAWKKPSFRRKRIKTRSILKTSSAIQLNIFSKKIIINHIYSLTKKLLLLWYLILVNMPFNSSQLSFKSLCLAIFWETFEKSLKLKINLLLCWVTKQQLCMDCIVFRLKLQWGILLVWNTIVL